jgi:hypothetical protein
MEEEIGDMEEDFEEEMEEHISDAMEEEFGDEPLEEDMDEAIGSEDVEIVKPSSKPSGSSKEVRQ